MLEQFTKNFLNVIHNGKPVQLGFKELFNPSDFDSLLVVSFVSSHAFMFSTIRNFKRVTVILGEEDSVKSFMSLNTAPEQTLVESIKDAEICRKIVSKEIEFRRISDDLLLHSKIYVAMKDGLPKRVGVGSANFTNTAMHGRQYEELLVFDEEPYVGLYHERYKEIYDESVDFLSDTTYRKLKEVIISAQQVTAGKIENSIIVADNLDALKIENSIIYTPYEKQEMLLDKCDGLRTKEGDAEEILRHINSQKDVLVNLERETRTVSEIMDNVTKKVKNQTIYKEPSEISKVKDTLKKVAYVTSRKTEDYIDKRNYFIFKDYHILKGEGAEGRPYTAEGISAEQLTEQLNKLERFISSYSLFTVNRNPENEKKVFEAILYAMISPFIWMMRRDISNKQGQEKLAEVPLMLILGGLANTGKSKLLMFINKLLGNDFDVFNYKDIDTREHRVISDMIESENIFPLLVDEIELKFFDSTSGQALIKNTANKLTKPHPCMIGTTNKEFSPRAEIVRRLHYIHFTESFSMSKGSKKKEEANEYLSKYVGDTDDTVFRCFIDRMLELIRHNSEEFYSPKDFLLFGRDIMKEMFADSGIRTDFISNEFMGDYYKVSSEEWRSVYAYHRDKFQERSDGGEKVLLLDIDSLPNSNQYSKKAENMKNKLPPEVIKNSGSAVLTLRKERFIEFIGGYEEGLQSRLMSIFRRNRR